MTLPDSPVGAVLTRASAGRLVADTAATLRGAGIPSPRLDAELLVGHAFGRDRAWLRAHPEQELGAGEARLLELERARQAEERGDQRRSQVGSGERAEKIRTYNFPDDRVTDHRVGITVHNLPGLLEGDLDRLIEPLAQADQAARLADFGSDDAA